MILDKDLLLMDDSSVAHTAGAVAFDNVIDLGVAHRGSGKPLKLFCQFTEGLDSANGAATITIAIAGGDTDALGTTLLTTGAINESTAIAGYKPPQINVALPDDCPRFIGGTYTIAGETSTKGKLTLGIVEDIQSNKDPVALGLTS
ncbi:TPA_asm: hypothetical protein vir555_00046 [Caudoviricetes sp. vir555]|nr:TPA_asm: hypothetical protein vir555_00046 [Caudoviricetes sp. vir555]